VTARPVTRNWPRGCVPGAPVIDQCRELDLRTAGADTTGVWGALAEDDRCALHSIWQRRRPHQHTRDQGGEPTP
jgi:hypothetical protein